MRTQFSKFALAAIFALAITFTFSCSSDDGDGGGSSPSGGGIKYGEMKDKEGKTYKTVKIGNQTWMAENLNYETAGSVCYDKKEANCVTYGRLYDWETAMSACPNGWHLPDTTEWNALVSVGGVETAGKHLKAKEGWNSCGPTGSGKSFSCEDTYGFSALPGGYGGSDGSFYGAGNYGLWWSASENNSYYAYFRGMYYYNEDARYDDGDKSDLFSVRCLQD